MRFIFRLVSSIGILILALCITVPVLLEKNIDPIIEHVVNNNIKAEVRYTDSRLSLIRNFPKASIIIEDLELINKAPFKGDTLVYAKSLEAHLSFSELFELYDNQSLQIDHIKIDKPILNLITNKEGDSNYDISLDETATSEKKLNDSISSVNLKVNLDYEIDNAKVIYRDSISHIYVVADKLFHKGKGDISSNGGGIDTDTDLLLTYKTDELAYIDSIPISLKAKILADIEHQRYTFEENKGTFNAIPLHLDGWVEFKETHTNADFSFNSEQALFANLINAIPNDYQQNLKGVETEGRLDVHGTIKGMYNAETLPKIEVILKTQNAYLKYDDFSKAVENISLEAQLSNQVNDIQGGADDLQLNLENFEMTIDQDHFKASGTLSNLIQNPTINMNMKGGVNLANLKNAYPIPDDMKDIEGQLDLDIHTHFDLESINNNNYKHIYSKGVVSISDFTHKLVGMPHSVNVKKMNLMFTPERIDLNNFEMLTGSSDLKAKGTLQNFIPFMISNKTLVGDFQFWSKDFTATDFMEEERDDSDSVAQGMTSEVETAMKIPDFIEFNSYFIADKVHYGNIDLDNAKGTLEVKDQKATLSNLSADFFGGTIGGTANLSTENDISNFEMNFDLDKVNIIDSFTNVEMLRKLAPISGAMNGLFSSELVVSGNTDQYMMPELSSLSGKASINILEATMYPPNSLTLRHINRQLKFIDWSSLKLKDLATSLKFNKGKIEVTPFELIIDDEIILNVKGAHYLDQHIDYDLDFDLPVKYLTNSYSNLLPDLSVDTASKNIHVTLPVKLREMFTSPMINIQIGAALNDFKKQLAQRETENVKKKIKSKVTKVLNQSPIASSKKVIIEELISPSKDSNNENTPKQLLQHKKQQVKSQAKKLLNGIFVK